MVIHVLGFKPLTDNEEDKEAVTRALAFGTAWYVYNYTIKLSGMRLEHMFI